MNHNLGTSYETSIVLGDASDADRQHCGVPISSSGRNLRHPRTTSKAVDE